LIVAAAAGGFDPNMALTAVLSAAAALGAAWITSRVAGRASRRDSMLQWAQQLQASEQAARKEAQESRDRADRIKDEADADVEQLRSQLDAIQIQLDMAQKAAARLTDTLISVAMEVWRPEPDVSALRRLVGRPQPPAVNGRPV
jgi:hypothetical protein